MNFLFFNGFYLLHFLIDFFYMMFRKRILMNTATEMFQQAPAQRLL